MSPHTPAPWFNDGYRIHAPTEDADKRNGRLIVEYKHVDDFNYDDSHLITAAPDMLEALKAVARWEDQIAAMPGGISDLVYAAIAKAEGK